MKRDNETLWLFGGIAAAMLLGGAVIPWGDGWMWPVPPVEFPDGVLYRPVVSSGFRPPVHFGVDVFYQRRGSTDRVAQFPPGSVNGSSGFFNPPGTPVIAARDARVWSTGQSAAFGNSVVLDHGAPFATFYQHLSQVTLVPHANGFPVGSKVPTMIKAGTKLGTMGFAPSDPERLRHLHFAVWFKGVGDRASVDPGPEMARWSLAPRWKL